ncbi:MAG: hypothetical protein FWH57_13285, partial [Oscillospiraceae bacterium]|nr:hypothetical protein [Oscillospiraceae bacterium]
MKNTFCWGILAIILLFTVSCNNLKTTTQLDDASLQNAATQLQDNLPEITDKLAICMYASEPGPSLWRDAIDNFREKYPDIEVTIDYIYPTTFLTNLKSEETGDESLKMGPEAHIQRIETEILSGHGVDILLLTVHSDGMAQLFPDMNKVALSGVFLDLNPYMNGSGLIDPDECFGNIITATSLNGQQSYLPLSFDVPIVLSTQANLNSIGFDVE